MKKEADKTAIIDLPYSMFFAVGTVDQVIIYSTESIYPISIIGNIHCATINDLTWEGSTKLLAASSDGYISVITLDPSVCGERLPLEDVPENMHDHYRTLESVSYAKEEEKVLALPKV